MRPIVKTVQSNRLPYHVIYEEVRQKILAASELEPDTLSAGADELGIHYEMYLFDYDGPLICDSYIGFRRMLREWGIPFPFYEDSSLNGMTLTEFYFVWAWEENEIARRCLDESLFMLDTLVDDVTCGVVSAISAAKSLKQALFMQKRQDRRLAQYRALTATAAMTSDQAIADGGRCEA
jgi:hypothetical protein